MAIVAIFERQPFTTTLALLKSAKGVVIDRSPHACVPATATNVPIPQVTPRYAALPLSSDSVAITPSPTMLAGDSIRHGI
jgi:hypothetical protein